MKPKKQHFLPSVLLQRNEVLATREYANSYVFTSGLLICTSSHNGVMSEFSNARLQQPFITGQYGSGETKCSRPRVSMRHDLPLRMWRVPRRPNCNHSRNTPKESWNKTLHCRKAGTNNWIWNHNHDHSYTTQTVYTIRLTAASQEKCNTQHSTTNCM